MDKYESVKYAGLDRPEYILRNGKAFNIYAAKKVLESQQAEIEALKAQLNLIKQKLSGATSDIESLFLQQPQKKEDGSYLVDGQAMTELAQAIFGNQQGDSNGK